MSFSPFPVTSTSTDSSGPMMPCSRATATPALEVMPAGSPKTPQSRAVCRIASRICSSLTRTKAPPLSRTALTALRQLRGTPTAMESAIVSGFISTSSPPLSNASATGAAPAACTPSSFGCFSAMPISAISARPLPTPAIVQPSPTETATQSGSLPASRSPISRPAVFLPSTR